MNPATGNKIISLIRLSRPLNVLIAFMTIIVAAELAGGLDPLLHVLLAALSASLITIGANVINDYYDIQIDQINKPNRPLAAAALSPKTALIYFAAVYVLAWFCAALISLLMFIIAFVFSHLLFLYSYKLKKTALWGNLLVSITTAMAFIYGGESVLNARGVLFPAGFAFFFHLGREILKDIEDMEGDCTAGALTFPIKYGIQASLNLILADFILLVILTLIPYILGIYNVTYLLIVCLGIYPVLIFVMLKMRQKPGAALIGKLSNLLKADMIVGLLAIYIS